MSSNLPPGVTDGMLPGNRSDDIAYEKMCEDLSNILDKVMLTISESAFDALAEWLWDYKVPRR